MSCWFRRCKGGVELTVRLTPRSSSNQVEGLTTRADGAEHLAARVRAVPEKGQANNALEKLVSEWVGTAKGNVSIAGGSTSRIKTIFISGDPDELAEKLKQLIEH